MNNYNYILIAIAALVILLVIGYSCRTCGGNNEYYHDYKAQFSTPGETIEFNSQNSNNFRIIDLNNPSDSKKVLEQFNFDESGYSFNIELEKNAYYKAQYWRANDDLYDAKNYDMQFLSNDKKINTKGVVSCNKVVDNLRWKKVEYVFNTNNNPVINVVIGNVGAFTQGTRYYADFRINRTFPKLKDFKYQDNLLAFYNLSSQDTTSLKTIEDKTERTNMDFESVVEMNTYGASLNNIKGVIGQSDKLLSDKSTIIFTYMPEENQNGSLIYAHAVNDYNLGLNIDFQTTYGVENYVLVKLVNKTYIYNIGLTTNPIVFKLVLDSGNPTLYINNHKTDPIKVNEPEKRQLGTCPDGFKAVKVDGIIKCQDISGLIPEGKCGTRESYHQFNTYTDEQKNNWAKNVCLVKWENCKQLNEYEIAPKGSDSCIPDSNLKYSGEYITINKDKSLSGRLHNLMIYSGILDNLTLTNIYKYIIIELVKLKSEDNCCSRPTLIKESVNSGSKQLCPFNDDKICKDSSCKCVDWGDSEALANINQECKTVINKHCRYNKEDKYCNELRDIKFGKNKQNIKALSKNRKSYGNTLGDSITKAPVIKNIANCENCSSNVDLTKYIRKDKIPCWGCNLGDLDKNDKSKHSCNLKNL